MMQNILESPVLQTHIFFHINLVKLKSRITNGAWNPLISDVEYSKALRYVAHNFQKHFEIVGFMLIPIQPKKCTVFKKIFPGAKKLVNLGLTVFCSVSLKLNNC